jgi:hypothetical protein
VRQAVAEHRKGHNYRVDVKGPAIVVYEREGADPADVVRELAGYFGPPDPRSANELREQSDKHARFAPVLRFILEDADKRTFATERWSWLGDIDDWIEIAVAGPLARCLRQTVPKLDTDAFFDLM